MTANVAEVIEQAMKLPPEERAQVINQLQQSLAPALDPEVEAALIEEMDRRCREVESGEAETFDNDQVVAELEAKYLARNNVRIVDALPGEEEDDMLPEYDVDFSKAKPNRFAERLRAQQVLELPAEARARIANLLLESLHPVDPEIEAAWVAEAERRLEAVLAGEEKTIPQEEVLAKLRARLRR